MSSTLVSQPARDRSTPSSPVAGLPGGVPSWGQVNCKGVVHWDVPYLTIDPGDIGREYREVIRVNAQSGKGGVAYLLESEFRMDLPKDMQREFGPIANDQVDALGREVTAEELRQMFWNEYVERRTPWSLIHFHADGVDGVFDCRASVVHQGREQSLTGRGNGPIVDAAQSTDTSNPASSTTASDMSSAILGPSPKPKYGTAERNTMNSDAALSGSR